MNCEDSFKTSVIVLTTKCHGVQIKWIAKDPSANEEIVQSLPSMDTKGGDYRLMGESRGNCNFSSCPRCDHPTNDTSQISAGCRYNGDAYGVIFKTCPNCGYLKWSSYDEA